MDYARRRGAVATALSRKKLNAFMVTSPESRRYLSGFTGEDMGCTETAGLMVIFKNASYLFTDGRFDTQARAETSGINIVTCKNGMELSIKKVFNEFNVKKVGFEAGTISVRLFEKIKNALDDVEFVALDELISGYRLEKDQEELDAIKEAVMVGEQCLEKALKAIKPGITEKEAQWIILKHIHQASDGPSFPPIVASGPNSAMPHAIAGDRILGEDEPIIIDMGVKLKGYASDMTRTIFFGEPPEKFKEIYSCVKAAKEEAERSIRAGMTGKEADSIARRIIRQAGFGQYFTHALGHGVGLSVHEAPTLSQRYRRRLRTNSVVTVEPGIYIPGQGGVRLEDMGVIREDSFEKMGSGKWIYDFH